ncbi:SKG-like transmembrane protein [Nocardiopsis suaedae]|uniref:SKG-like transmembrane protein n=1 Tax=Nocardiopsis suaedae TaxID=3018444 RepID=A0ABT4TEL0_9ACTN|nr:SKG-like transmembrane protein [Nocardiopsis suaedae]MDA2803085.1 SKG-like transmembrane protein [Nocardiopsis suaedae]
MEDLGLSWLPWLVSVIAAVAIPVGVILLVVGLLTYARRDAERRGGRPEPEDGGTEAGEDGEDGPPGPDDGTEPDDGGTGPDDDGDDGGGDGRGRS